MSEKLCELIHAVDRLLREVDLLEKRLGEAEKNLEELMRRGNL